MNGEARPFRAVMGRFATGVTVVTATGARGPVGMTANAVCSLSLDPLLLLVCFDNQARTLEVVRDTRRFGVNVLAADQEDVCRVFATKGADKFAGLGWKPGATGAPRLADVLAWIDCEIDAVHDAGDHEVCIGRVRELDVERREGPLVFFRGGYGRFEL